MSEMGMHKAEPLDASRDWQQPCRFCGHDVKRVPGGSGPTWVHVDTGMVVGTHERREGSDG